MPSNPILSRIAGLLGLLCMLVIGASLLAHFSSAVHPRFITRDDAVDSQLAIIERRLMVFDGDPVEWPSWRNRILVPYAIQGLAAATGASFSQSYVAVR